VIITTEPRNHPDTDLQEVANEEIGRLRGRLARTLTNLHNLIAAARATLRAHADGEDDALYYLRDELEAQGQLPLQDRERP
jgi:hypothetical protein